MAKPEQASRRSVGGEIWRGAEWLGRVIAGFGAFNFLLNSRPLPVSEWLDWGLTLYRDVFHGLLDHSVGFLLSQLGLVLPQWAKDPLIIYGILTASIYRGFLRMNRNLTDERLEQKTDEDGPWGMIQFVLIWPISLPLGFLIVAFDDRVFPHNEATPGNLVRNLGPPVLLELLIVLGIMGLLLVSTALGL